MNKQEKENSLQQGYLVIDENLMVKSVSESLRTIMPGLPAAADNSASAADYFPDLDISSELEQLKNDHDFSVSLQQPQLKQSNNLLTLHGIPFFTNNTFLGGILIVTAPEQQVESHLFKKLLESSKELVVIYNKHGAIEFVNREFKKLLKFNDEQLRNLRLTDVINITFEQKIEITVERLLNLEPNKELPLIDSEGTVHYMYSRFNELPAAMAEKGKSYIGQFTDITELKRARQELMLMHSVFDASHDGIAVESGGQFILANDSFAHIFGFDEGTELIGRTFTEFIEDTGSDFAAHYQSNAQYASNMKQSFDFLAKHKDGSTFFAEASTTTFEFYDAHFIVIVARDISERKRVQEEIHASEERYRSITENIDDFFWVAERVDNKLKTIFYTNSVEKITGHTQHELLRQSRLFFHLVHPDDFQQMKSELKAFINNTYKSSEAIEFRIVHSSGNIVWVRNKLNVIRDSTGKIEKIYGLVSDITLQKKAEKELQNSAENLRNLNATKDRFISIVSHDLRTPFSSILGFTDILLGEERLTFEEQQEYISYIQEASKNMLSLVNTLLDWTRLQTGRMSFHPERYDLRQLVNKSFKSVQGAALQKQIELSSAIDEEINVFVDKQLIAQVFNNLFSNAIKFTPSNGSIQVNAWQAEHKRFIEVAVSDTGVGIKKENLGKIFSIESKFTTIGTAGEKGTGFGMNLVREIIEKHGGTIRVESIEGKGTTFYFTIPRASASILLLDRKNTDRILYSKILKNITENYEIETSNDPERALEMIHSAPPALLILDHQFTDTNGFEIVKKLDEQMGEQRIPIMILSADVGKSEKLAYNEMGIEYVFNKPVILSALKEAIDRLIHQM